MDSSVFTDASDILDSARPRGTSAPPRDSCSGCFYYDLMSVLATTQEYNVDFLAVNWQPSLGTLGRGASGVVHQSSVIKDLGLAFKQFSAPSGSVATPEEKLQFQALKREISILQTPSIRNSRYIINLEGVFWNTETTSAFFGMSPVLVYRLGNLGTLKDLLDRTPVSLDVKLGWMRYIGQGMMALHASGVVHGDLKPENIIMFAYSVEEGKSITIPKIADFSFSYQSLTGDERMRLPRSEPWCAPEWHHREHSIKQGQAMDTFSFGLLCFWFLFRDRIYKGFSYEQELEDLKSLKLENKLIDVACKELDSLHLPEATYRVLKDLFIGTLCHGPQSRYQQVTSEIPLLHGFANPPLGEFIEPNTSPHPQFKLCNSFDQLAQVDFRVRYVIFQMFERASSSPCSECARIAALQTAICHQLAFGTDGDPHKAADWLSKHGVDKSALAQELEVIKDCHFPERTNELKWYIESDLLNQYQKRKDLDEALRFHSREVSALEANFGPSHPLVTTCQSIMVLLLDLAGRTSESLQLCEKQHRILKSKLPDDDAGFLASEAQLVRFHSKMGNDSQAIEIGEKLVDRCRRALGLTHRTTWAAMGNLSGAYMNHFRYEEAEAIMEELLKIYENGLGNDHPDALINRGNLAKSYFYSYRNRLQEALVLQKYVVKACGREFGPTHRYTIEATSTFAIMLAAKGGYEDLVEELHECAITTAQDQFAENSSDVLRSSINYAVSLSRRDRHQEAITVLLQCLSSVEKVRPLEHQDVLDVVLALGSEYSLDGKYSEAESFLQRVVESSICVSQARTDYGLRAWYSLGHVHQGRGNDTLAQEAWEKAKDLGYKHYGLGHDVLRKTISHLAPLYISERRYSEGIEMLKQLAEWCVEHLGADHLESIMAQQELGVNYLEIGLYETSKNILSNVLPVAEKVLGPIHETTLVIQGNLSVALIRLGELEASVELCENVFEKRRETHGATHDDTLVGMRNLLKVYTEMDRHSKVQELAQILGQLLAANGDGSNQHHDVMLELLGFYYWKSGKVREGEEFFRKQLEDLERNTPEGTTCLAAKHSLAYVLSDTESVEEAETLARAAYEGRKLIFGWSSTAACESIGLLGVILRDQGKLKEAEEAFEEELRAYEQGVGHNPMDAIWAMKHLITVYERQNRVSKVAEMRTLIEELEKSPTLVDSD